MRTVASVTGAGRSVLSTILLLAGTAAVSRAAADPLPEVTGWRRTGKTTSFDAKTIWQEINGAAELYLSYGFKELRLQRYSRGEGQEVAIHVYDMGRPLHAFGVYWRERPRSAKAIRAGTGTRAAFSAPYHCLALRGRFYVKVVVAKGGLKSESCGPLLTAITGSLSGAAVPREVSLLPSAGQVQGSIRYTRRGYLGLRELVDCLHATYGDKPKGRYELFMLLPGAKRSQDLIWKQLAARWKRQRRGGLTMLSRTVPYRGTIAVVRTPRGIYGASHPKGMAAALKILGDLKVNRSKAPRSEQ
jgi:hypothetical protein